MKTYAAALFAFLLAGIAGVFFASPDPTSFVLFKMPPAPPGPNGKTIAEELGFAPDAKLLVVNSDDSCGHPAFTEGVIEVLSSGIMKSTSVIVHDRNDGDLRRLAALAKDHPEWGIGIHLTLTNEYQQGYPWKPVLSAQQVPSLYNAKGLAWEKISEVETFVDPAHAALEFEAQIAKALRLGIALTHIDSHMGTAYRNSRFPGAAADGLRMAAIRAAEKFDLPLTMNTFDEASAQSMEYMDQHQLIRPDTFFGFYELAELNSHLSYEGPAIQRWITALVVKQVFGFALPYRNYDSVGEDLEARGEIVRQAILNIVKPGLNHFYMHAAVAESVSGDRIPSGMNHPSGVDEIVRLSDSAVWSSDEMAQFLEDQGIKLINYSQIRKIQQARRAQRPAS
jgi:predicted glycoside hydrolase/deacetylase ChbG (UPF0249 family)